MDILVEDTLEKKVISHATQQRVYVRGTSSDSHLYIETYSYVHVMEHATLIVVLFLLLKDFLRLIGMVVGGSAEKSSSFIDNV